MSKLNLGMDGMDKGKVYFIPSRYECWEDAKNSKGFQDWKNVYYDLRNLQDCNNLHNFILNPYVEKCECMIWIRVDENSNKQLVIRSSRLPDRV